jgi:UDP-N-acetylmuramoylalanine--D-glutamate ligase
VAFVDDSKATNPGSVIAALHAFDRPVVLIAGGKAKGTDFGAMGREIAKRTSGAVLIGEAAGEIARAISGVPVERAASMEEAVDRAAALAPPHGIVLLSPGCASFDMFVSAEARGNAFIAAVAARTKAARGGSALS